MAEKMARTDQGSNAGSLRQEESLLRVEDFARFVYRSWWIILGGTLLLGVGTAVLILLVTRPEYEASATLVVSPPTFSSDLKPSSLTVQGYQSLLESDAVVSETKRRLVADSEIAADASLLLGRQLYTRIFVSRRSEEKALAPMIELIARHASAETAEAIASTWAGVFLERTEDLSSRTTMMTVEFVLQQYAKARETLEELEQEALEAADRYQEQLDELKVGWDRRLVSFRKKSEDLTATYQTETRVLMEDLVEEWVTGKASPDGSRAPVRATEELLRLAVLRTQLAQTPQLLVLEKGISGDAIWQTMVLDPDRLFELQRRGLLTQEPNPAYFEINLRLSRIEEELEGDALRAADPIRDFLVALESLQRKRTAGLAKLTADRALELDVLRLGKARETESLRRSKEADLNRLNRKVEHSRQLFDSLALKQKQADLAQTEGRIRDVHLASPAVPPPRPESRGVVLKGLIAGVVGALLGMGVAFVRETAVMEPDQKT